MRTVNKTRGGGEDGEGGDGPRLKENVRMGRRLSFCREKDAENSCKEAEVLGETVEIKEMRDVWRQDGLKVKKDERKEMSSADAILLETRATIKTKKEGGVHVRSTEKLRKR